MLSRRTRSACSFDVSLVTLFKSRLPTCCTRLPMLVSRHANKRIHERWNRGDYRSRHWRNLGACQDGWFVWVDSSAKTRTHDVRQILVEAADHRTYHATRVRASLTSTRYCRMRGQVIPLIQQRPQGHLTSLHALVERLRYKLLHSGQCGRTLPQSRSQCFVFG